MAGIIHIIGVTAGPACYEILVGSDFFSEALRRSVIPSAERIALIVSSRIYELHRRIISQELEDREGRSFLLLMEDREENKSYAYAERFLERFIAEKLNRRSIVIGVGGGVVGDFAGFCSGIYMRGIPIVHVPTTLLAMVDSSVGGKAAVNLSVGKNIVGLFHQPALVISDVRFLRSLPDVEVRNGLTECFKHGLLGDFGTLELLESNDLQSIKRESVLCDLVAMSARFKSGIVEKDEKETGLRAALNFGHTIGHAIESSAGYRGVAHGQAVATGIKIKVEISRRMGLLTAAEAGRAEGIIRRYGLLPEKLDMDIEKVIRHMEYDKKNFGGTVNFVMLNGLGNPRLNQGISPDLLKEVMVELC
jgi:3-dehydroquinate synthase